MSRVLVVGAQRRLVETVRRTLNRAGYSVSIAHTLQDAIETCHAPAPDVVVLDDALPESGSLELLRYVRSRPELSVVPVLVLAGPGETSSACPALVEGADACLPKPLEARQLSPEVAALLQTAAARPRTVTRVSGPVRIDVAAGTTHVDGVLVSLTPVEFRLLLYLVEHAGEAVPAPSLLERVWGYPPGSGSGSLVRMHILNLRSKLESDPHNPRLIRTLPKHGYVWSVAA